MVTGVQTCALPIYIIEKNGDKYGPLYTIVFASEPYLSPFFSIISCLCGCITLKYVRSMKYAHGSFKVNSKVLSSIALTPKSSALAFPALNSVAFFIGYNRNAYGDAVSWFNVLVIP